MKYNIFFIIAIAYSAFAANINETKVDSMDIHSIFTYKDGMKYFENLKCNNDNDCPERATCIGNKCITSIYCKNDDKSTCALFYTFCDGKPCYKSNNHCDKNEDCLEGKCHSLSTGKSVCFSVNEYATGFFSYEDAETIYGKLDIECKTAEVCPGHGYCYCGNNSNCHCVTQFYCKENNTVCSFIHDRNEFNVVVDLPEIKDESSDETPTSSILFFIFNYILLPIVLCSCICLCIYIYVKKYTGRKNGSGKDSDTNLKLLIKVAIIVITIVEIITFIMRYSKYISWYDYDICYYFHYSLEENEVKESMSEKSYSTLSKIAREYPLFSDSSGLTHALDQGLAFLIMIISSIFLLITLICSVTKCCQKSNICMYCSCTIAYLFCIIGNSICLLQERSLEPTISLALTSVSKEGIDKDIYEKLKDNLDVYYYGRKAWLKFYSIIILCECIIQMILIINYKDDIHHFEPESTKELIHPNVSSSSVQEEDS